MIASATFPILPPHHKVELTDSRLVIRGNGRRELEWRDIAGMEIRKTAGIRTVIVPVTDGRRISLRAPMPPVTHGRQGHLTLIPGRVECEPGMTLITLRSVVIAEKDIPLNTLKAPPDLLR